MIAHQGVAVAVVDFRNCEQGGKSNPEVKEYPGGLNDCYSGLQWVQDHAAELRIDPGQTIVAGPSGGGNLTIAVALLAKQRGKLDLLPQGFYALCPYIAGTWPQDVRGASPSLADDGLWGGGVWGLRSKL